jgi:eukaryotic-like serine/threonine-protein kinase
MVAQPDSCPPEDQLIACAAGSKRQSGQRELLLHVDICSKCRYLLAEICRSLHTRPSEAGTHTFAQGDLIVDRYRIVRFLAQGGMGEVYLAEDCLLEEWVALKTLACTALDDERAAFRFKAEARLARRVTHPNVCRVLEYGVHTRRHDKTRAESIPFLTMEFLAGETLARRVERRGRLPDSVATMVIKNVVAGLQAIHACGIVHRDFKSENVFLVPDSQGQRVLVMDFGLARALDGSVPSTAPMQRMLVGTLDTMAPEQLEGKPPTRAVDVYALGIFLFEVLTGRRPFVNLAPEERLRARVPAVSTVVKGVDARWDGVVSRCLEPDPAARFANMNEVREALGRVSAALAAHPPS